MGIAGPWTLWLFPVSYYFLPTCLTVLSSFSPVYYLGFYLTSLSVPFQPPDKNTILDEPKGLAFIMAACRQPVTAKKTKSLRGQMGTAVDSRSPPPTRCRASAVSSRCPSILYFHVKSLLLSNLVQSHPQQDESLPPSHREQKPDTQTCLSSPRKSTCICTLFPTFVQILMGQHPTFPAAQAPSVTTSDFSYLFNLSLCRLLKSTLLRYNLHTAL